MEIFFNIHLYKGILEGMTPISTKKAEHGGVRLFYPTDCRKHKQEDPGPGKPGLKETPYLQNDQSKIGCKCSSSIRVLN
jgi:hypothetical protein